MPFRVFRAGGEVAGSTGQLIPSTQVQLQSDSKLFQTSNFKARIVSTETGKDVQLGEAGELLVRGPQVQIITITIVSDSKGFHQLKKQTEQY